MTQARFHPLDLEMINRSQQCRSWYLADGRVGPAVSHHDVGVQVDVAQRHRGGAHHHRAAHLAADALRGACRGGEMSLKRALKKVPTGSVAVKTRLTQTKTLSRPESVFIKNPQWAQSRTETRPNKKASESETTPLKCDLETQTNVEKCNTTVWQTMASVAVETGPAVAAEACGVVGAECILGALLLEPGNAKRAGKRRIEEMKAADFLTNSLCSNETTTGG